MRATITVRTRGQVMVLGVMTLLVLAVMMMLTFTVNNAVHEKIRIQSHSDAIAYSSAVIQARAFNSMVYSNRAIAAAVVAQMTVHAWMNTASSTNATLFNAAIAFGIIAAMEFIEAGFCPFPCCVFIHCVHSLEAIIIMIKYFMKWNDYKQKVEGAEEKFNKAVESIKEMVDDIHEKQKDILDNAKSAIGSIPNTLNSTNANRATVGGFADANQKTFACALEGSDFDDDCGDSNHPKASQSDRSKVMQNAANAMRPFYPQLLNIMDLHEDFKTGSDFLKDIQNNEGNPVNMKFGSAYTGDGEGMFSDDGAQSKNVGAMTISAFFTTWRDGVGGMVMPVKVFSDANGGSHGFPSGHSGSHDKFQGVQQEDVCGSDKNCFINFRALNDANKDFGQPTSLASVKYDSLHEKMSGGGRNLNHWMITESGNVELATGGGGSAKVMLIPRKPGFAISKAKTYFHQIGDWSAPPNFFDPFWRAKLHFFSRQEAQDTANTAGDSDGANNAANAPFPVEGVQ